MITAQQNNSANGAAFEGNIVVFENRPFSIDNGVVAGETVVEGVFGASSNVSPAEQRRATAPAPTGPCCCAGIAYPARPRRQGWRLDRRRHLRAQPEPGLQPVLPATRPPDLPGWCRTR